MRNRSAETLIEVLMALSVIMYVLAPAAAVFKSGLRGLSANRHQLIAANLVEEGIVAVSNIIDSNLIRLKENRRNCWNVREEVTDTERCSDPPNKIPGNQSYRLSLDLLSLRFRLEPVTARLDFLDCLEGFEPPCISEKEKEYQLLLDNTETRLYNHTEGTTTPFFREVFLEYADNNSDQENDILIVTSKVLWKEIGERRKIELTKSLSRSEL